MTRHSNTFDVSCRPDWTTQHLHLWAPFVEKHAQLPMPLHPDTELCPIDMTDLCSVVQAIVLNWDHSILPVHLDNEHDGQVYTLTGPEPVTAKELVTRLAKATGCDSLKYKAVRPMDTQFYLEQLAHDIWFDARIKQEQRLMYNDPLSKGAYDYSTRAFALPTGILQQWNHFIHLKHHSIFSYSHWYHGAIPWLGTWDLQQHVCATCRHALISASIFCGSFLPRKRHQFQATCVIIDLISSSVNSPHINNEVGTLYANNQSLNMLRSIVGHSSCNCDG